MKRFFAILAALCLLCSAALAETIVETHEFGDEYRTLTLNKGSGTLLARCQDRSYVVIDADGAVLSDAYADANVREGYYEVANESVVNCWGMLDGQGQLVIPMMYGDIEYISDRWQAGIVLTPSSAENYDYKTLFSSTQQFFLVDTVDIYYLGTKVGTLDRMSWNSATAHGDYLCVTTRDRNYLYYSKEFKATHPESSREFDEDYRAKTITHAGSGQLAFTEGCTLTEDEVEQTIWITNDNDVLNLQGEVIGHLDADYGYPSGSFGGYLRIRKDSLYGLAKTDGTIVIPCEYDELSSNIQGALITGYIYAEKNGKAGFVNIATGEETGFKYSEKACKNFNAFLRVEDLDGTMILVSAMDGTLPERYTDIQGASEYSTGGCPFVKVANEEGAVGVVGLHGEAIIPLDGTYSSIYNIEITNDGSVILGRTAEGKYIAYKVSYDPTPAE